MAFALQPSRCRAGAPTLLSRRLHGDRRISSYTYTAYKRHDNTSDALAIDVEYSHVLLSDGTSTSLAAQVCLVSHKSGTILKLYCRNPLLEAASGSDETHVVCTTGGVRMVSMLGATPLPDVASEVLRLWEGHVLVGHGLAKDLHALGIAEEAQHRETYDTTTYKKFQSHGGSAKSLRQLAKEFLGVIIQSSAKLHDPEEDARAVLRLYMEHVRPKLLDSYKDLVAHYEQEFLRSAPKGQSGMLETNLEQDSS